MSTTNKVKYNLKNCHYAKITGYDSVTGAPQYATPVALPGAVSMSLEANGEPENFYADGIAYYVINNNMGYEGDLELALIPDEFRRDILGETEDATDKVLQEFSGSQLGHFALMFEFNGDAKNIRHCLYNCTASRPAIASATMEESVEVQTETLTLKATPIEIGEDYPVIKAKTESDVADAVYAAWFTYPYGLTAPTNGEGGETEQSE